MNLRPVGLTPDRHPPTPRMSQLVKFLAVLSVAAMVLAVSQGALRPPSGAMSNIPGEIPR